MHGGRLNGSKSTEEVVHIADAWLQRWRQAREERQRGQSCEKKDIRVRDVGVGRRGEKWCAYIQYEGQEPFERCEGGWGQKCSSPDGRQQPMP